MYCFGDTSLARYERTTPDSEQGPNVAGCLSIGQLLSLAWAYVYRVNCCRTVQVDELAKVTPTYTYSVLNESIHTLHYNIHENRA